MSSSPLILRPHHILCLQGFQHKGYDSDFVNQLAQIHQKFYQNPESCPVTLKITQDDICQHCPHHRVTECQKDATANERMIKRDQATLTKLKSDDGTTKTAHEWLLETKKFYHSKQDAEDSCFSCEWHSDCLWYQRLND